MQKGSQESACTYYAMNMLRPRIGKHPTVQSLPARNFERLASSRRKKIENHVGSLPGPCFVLRDPQMQEFLMKLTKAASSQNLHPFAQLVFEEGFTKAKEGFEKSTFKNWYEYLYHLTFDERNQITEDFLNKNGITDLENRYAQKKDLQPEIFPKEWKEMDAAEKGPVIDAIARDVLVEGFGFIKSTWRPSDGIKGLAEAIRENGPLIAHGTLGKASHATEPRVLKNHIEGEQVYVFPKGEGRVKKTSGHSVVVIGCRMITEEAGMVYFHDPVDDSKPDAPRKVYAVSYKDFTDDLSDLNGAIGLKTDSPAGYFLIGPARPGEPA